MTVKINERNEYNFFTMPKKELKKEKTYLESVTDKVGETAVNYGFAVIKPPPIILDDIHEAKQFKDFDYYGDALEKVALTRWYTEGKHDLEPQPLAIHYKKPLPGNPVKKKSSVEMYGFEIIGSSRSTSEALLLKCVLAVLDDLGYKDLYIDINSIGDKESIGRFERELGAYYRKNAHILIGKVRQEFKKNHYSILTNTYSEMKDFRQGAPDPISFLSDISRSHFKEVLESVEAFGVSYKIKPSTLSNKLYGSYTVFEIRRPTHKTSSTTTEENGELLAYGYRYNHLAKKIGGKRDIPTVGATIIVKKNPKFSKKVMVKNIKKPSFYLAQLGETAKIKVLNIVEMLRKEKIPVWHSITKDKITGQLSGAEYMKATHVLIMGQKEAIENSMVVRDMANREQETVSVALLPEFLKKLKKNKK